ncbi:MAG: rhomboid family intramembrane serine protease [Thermodesulfobacteriota bacterium]|nr:rhomboid family intramembrane serine protease [Thermodesulfobacteriota bacterium]
MDRRSILCPHCRKLISIDAPVCPHCGMSRPGSWWKGHVVGGGYLDGETIVRSIIYANVAMYVVSILLNPAQLGLSANPFTLFSPSDKALLLLGATGSIPIGRLHRWWTLVSASYLHGGILHIFFNMVVLRQIGPLVVREYGVHRMAILYTLGGVIGFWVSYLVGIPLTIGASAAVCSLIGATLYYGKSRGGMYGQAIYRQVGGWVIALFFFGFIVPGINNWAHGGGIGAGILVGFLLGYEEKAGENAFHRALATGCFLVTVVILLWAVVSAFYYRLFA